MSKTVGEWDEEKQRASFPCEKKSNDQQNLTDIPIRNERQKTLWSDD